MSVMCSLRFALTSVADSCVQPHGLAPLNPKSYDVSIEARKFRLEHANASGSTAAASFRDALVIECQPASNRRYDRSL